MLSSAGKPFKFSNNKKVAILKDKAALDGGSLNPADFLLSAIYGFETNTTNYHPSIPNGYFEGYYQAGIPEKNLLKFPDASAVKTANQIKVSIWDDDGVAFKDEAEVSTLVFSTTNFDANYTAQGKVNPIFS